MVRPAGHYFPLLRLLRFSEAPLLPQNRKLIYQSASPSEPPLERVNTVWIKAGVHTRTEGGGEFALALRATPPVWFARDEKKPARGGLFSLAW